MSTPSERVERFNERARVRAWEFRQRRHAKGAWPRLRLALAHAREAYSVDEASMAALLAEGFARLGVGDEFEPRKDIVVVPSERASRIAGARPLVVRLSAELLRAPRVVLVAF